MHRSIQTAWKAEQQRAKEKKAWQKKHANEIDRVMKELAAIETSMVNVIFDATTLDLYYSGDFTILKGIFHAMRKAGYVTDEKVAEDQTKVPSHTMWWRHPKRTHIDGIATHPQFYIQYASTVCKRVKVGTKMIESPIYEVTCE